YYSKTTYYRLYIAELYPEYNKVIYIDSDTVVQGDISELYNTDVSDYPIGAVRDRFMEAKYYRRYNIPKGTPVFNAGIMLINLANWRETGLHKKALDYSAETGLNDQISLNTLLRGNWLPLDYRWNMVTGYYRRYYNYAMNKLYPFPFANVTERIKDPYILHTTGSKKLSDYSYKYLFAEEYFRYLDMTPWRGYKPTDKNILTACDRIYNRVRIKIIDAINK
ncbi:MAG: glycosyltransferase family 8 protein, partial [Abditibacteriota bacterium]|nr:glycosyltransferase family 8 protein [Abditibacteriota bacterium]